MDKLFVNFLPPWVETNIQPAFYDKESGSVLQQTARMYAKVNCLVRMFNKLSKETKETVDEYISKFVELKDFVDTYFENLDVQEEINNKLDQMAEDGTLQEIITTYIQSNVKWTFDTVSDMQNATNLIDGSYATTLGFYSVGDGGGSTYLIKDATGITTNGMDKIAIGGDLYADLVLPDNDTINIRQLGAKSYEDNSGVMFDCHDYINRFVSIKHDAGKTLTLYIPTGRWATTPLLINESSLKIIGNEAFLDNESLSSVITPYQDNQSYVLKFGGFSDFGVTSTDATRGISVKNIVFSARYSDDTSEWYHVENGLLCLDFCLYSFFDNIFFQKFDGQGLYMRSCWEIYFGTLNFRTKTNPDYPCILFDNIGAFITGANLSALDFNNLMFEGIDGTMIKSKENSSFTHSNFNNINIEYTTGTTDSHRSEMTQNEDVSGYHEMAMFDGKAEYVTFNNINFYMQHDYKLTFDSDVYYLSALFRNSQENLTGATVFLQNITVNSIIFKTFADCHTKVALNRNSNASTSGLAIGNLVYPVRSPINMFNFEYGAKVHVANLVNGDAPAYPFTPFSDCTTFYNNRGVLVSDANAQNKYGLVYKKPSIGINSQNMNTEDGRFVYPYNNTDTVKIRVRLKAENGVSYKLIMRGTFNGASKDYSIEGTGTGNYVIEEKEIAYDANTIVKFMESLATANCYIDWFKLG